MAWSFAHREIRCYRKRIIVIAAEGEVTEPQYFQGLNSMSQTTVFTLVENLGNGSDPRAVLARMKKYLKENPLEAGDEAWIVIDQDKWTDDSIKKIKDWAIQSQSKYHYAISIRRFEDWLKVHVDGDNAAKKKYRNFLLGKEKHIPDDFLTKARVLHAMEKARTLVSTPKSVGNVFELMDSFFAMNAQNVTPHKKKK